MLIRVIGDTHGVCNKIIRNTDCDIVVVLGDFGFTGEELTDLDKFLWERGIELLFVDGNHEDYGMLGLVDDVEMYGGRIGVCGNSIYWLKRGEVYDLLGVKILVFGGAYSVDRVYRVEGLSWFKEEEYSREDFKRLEKNIVKYGYSFDYILTHDCPLYLAEKIHGRGLKKSRTAELLGSISRVCDFKKWLFGHHHIDIEFGRYIGLWEKDYLIEI